jgi:hypothetical protein
MNTPFVRGFTAEQSFPLPAGTPLFIKFLRYDLNSTGNPRKHGVFGTHEIDSKEQHKAYDQMCHYEVRNVIPHQGKSTYNCSPLVGATLKRNNQSVICENIFRNQLCGGIFKSTVDGEYFCNNCGIEYLEEKDIPTELYRADPYLGSTEPYALQSLTQRACSDLSYDIQTIVQHRSCINKEKTEYRKAQILLSIKSGIDTTAELSKLLQIHRTTIVNLLKSLEKKGYIRSTKKSKTRRYTLKRRH